MLLALAGCATVKSGDSDFTQAEADAITAKCKAPEGMLRVKRGQLTLWPVGNPDYDASLCILQEIKASGKSKFGFVGNEKIETSEGGNAQTH